MFLQVVHSVGFALAVCPIKYVCYKDLFHQQCTHESVTPRGLYPSLASFKLTIQTFLTSIKYVTHIPHARYIFVLLECQLYWTQKEIFLPLVIARLETDNFPISFLILHENETKTEQNLCLFWWGGNYTLAHVKSPKLLLNTLRIRNEQYHWYHA